MPLISAFDTESVTNLLIVYTTQVKAQIKTSYIPNNQTKHMNDIKHVLPGIFVPIVMEKMYFCEKVNKSLGVPCTEQRHREVPSFDL